MFNATRSAIWTDERIELLKRRSAEGLTRLEIAAEMGCFDHCADKGRSAVSGKLHRLGMSLKPVVKKVVLRIVAPPKAPVILESEPYGPGIQVIHLTNENCHFPNGDPREHGFEFCGAPAVSGLPYCHRHCALAYRTDNAPFPT